MHFSIEYFPRGKAWTSTLIAFGGVGCDMSKMTNVSMELPLGNLTLLLWDIKKCIIIKKYFQGGVSESAEMEPQTIDYREKNNYPEEK